MQETIQSYTDNFIPVLPMEQESVTRHTERDPFCFDHPTCPCHQDHAAISHVYEQVAQGLLTAEEALRIIDGYML